STNSPTAFMFAKYWLLRCLKSHRSCQGISESGSELPTRLIDSYRWASDVKPMTGESIAALKQSLPRDILPKLIQDAIIISKELGIQFLWVDVYYIFQDDKEDWMRESQNMHQVYRNSVLTIALNDEPKKDTGIFEPRYERSVRDRSTRRPHGELDSRGWTMQE
ncbi:hypothetical protein B0J11DRAFT_447903, partial [Dendryphion nanum]